MNNYCGSKDLSYAGQFGCQLGTIKLYFKHIQLEFDFGMWRNGLPIRLAIVEPLVWAIHVLLDHHGHSNWNVRDGDILHLVSTYLKLLALINHVNSYLYSFAVHWSRLFYRKLLSTGGIRRRVQCPSPGAFHSIGFTMELQNYLTSYVSSHQP